jgi:blue copper oxidase
MMSQGGAYMLTRRQFAARSVAVMSTGLGSPYGYADTVRSDTPLLIPKLIDAAKQANAVSLTVAAGRHAFVRGKPAVTYGYSAPILGPVIRVRRGDDVAMTVENALDRDTTVHWHGLSISGDVDGGPHQVIKPGKTWHPVLKIDQAASTAWFHPHHDTARQVYMGLAGMIIIDDGSDAHIDLPRSYGVDDLPIIVQDRSFEDDGSLVYSPSPLSITYGSRGDTIIVNGGINPVARVPRGIVRLRILDAANARNFYLRFGDQRMFHVIASDRGFLAAPVNVRQLRISPGERFEVLVDFSDGKAVTLQTGPDEELGLFGGMTEHRIDAEFEPVMRFEPSAGLAAVRSLPTRLIEPGAANLITSARRRQFILDSSMCTDQGRPAAVRTGVTADMGRIMCINGKPHDMARIDEEVRIGTTEVWQIFSVGMTHPFHIHGASFRILSIGDQPPPAHLMGWKDMVLVEEKAELLVAFDRAASPQSPFMYHCHILEHEDAGMMGQFVCA